MHATIMVDVTVYAASGKLNELTAWYAVIYNYN